MEAGKIEDVLGFDFSLELHCTDFFEILIIGSGQGHIMLDSEKINISGSSVLFISPFQKRKWFLEKGIKGYFLVFEKAFLNTFFSDKLFVYKLQYFYNPFIKTHLKLNESIFAFEQDIFDEMAQEIKNTQDDSAHLLRAILYYVLIKLNRKFCTFHDLQSKTNQNINAYRFKEVLINNIREKQRVNDYAEILGITRIALNTAVKKEFGKTVSTMINDFLLDEIKDELTYTAKTISEIAFELNFSEPQHLIRFFKRKMKITPLEYRATYQNGY